jgi:adenylate cyclase
LTLQSIRAISSPQPSAAAAFQFGEPALADFVSGTLAAAPQVYGLIVSDRNGEALRVVRGAAGTDFAIDHFNVAADSQFAALADQIRTHKYVLAREPSVGGEHYSSLQREVSDYGELPITVGTYFLKRAVDGPIRLFYWATIVAVGLLGLSLIVAALMAGAISRPIRRAARGATAIGNLDFDDVVPLAGSYFREINSLARSFNAMLDGLRAFGRYVPRTLVMRLVKEGRVGAGTEERVLAMMFTDIVSFTSACEKMSAAEVADFINQHLSLVAACIEREGGTIDKFIGDAVMAFWGAPGRIENPAASACRAAVAIQRALAADNKRRIAAGLNPVRIRMGIHMGQVIVGDIGAPNRINYTIVGDVVNATQRLESLGKTIDPDAEAVALVSEEIFAAAPDGFQFIERGTHLVKGKQESLRVFQLIGDQEGGSRSG